MYELALEILKRNRLGDLVNEVRSELDVLVVLYADAICRQMSECLPEAAIASALFIESMIEGRRLDTSILPRHVHAHVTKAIGEAEDAALRAPTSLYAQLALDADALARIGAASMLIRSRGRDLRSLLRDFAEALSYAYSADYIIYTKPAKSLAQLLKPHTIAMAKWLVEELASLGIEASIRADRTAGGLVAYVDMHSCFGLRVSKLASVKPIKNCITYRLAYECNAMKVEYEICIPESTRTK